MIITVSDTKLFMLSYTYHFCTSVKAREATNSENKSIF